MSTVPSAGDSSSGADLVTQVTVRSISAQAWYNVMSDAFEREQRTQSGTVSATSPDSATRRTESGPSSSAWQISAPELPGHAEPVVLDLSTATERHAKLSVVPTRGERAESERLYEEDR